MAFIGIRPTAEEEANDIAKALHDDGLCDGRHYCDFCDDEAAAERQERDAKAMRQALRILDRIDHKI